MRTSGKEVGVLKRDLARWPRRISDGGELAAEAAPTGVRTPCRDFHSGGEELAAVSRSYEGRGLRSSQRPQRADLWAHSPNQIVRHLELRVVRIVL
jgi:hypothetical protein